VTWCKNYRGTWCKNYRGTWKLKWDLVWDLTGDLVWGLRWVLELEVCLGVGLDAFIPRLRRKRRAYRFEAKKFKGGKNRRRIYASVTAE
jgi:hypothetical protein